MSNTVNIEQQNKHSKTKRHSGRVHELLDCHPKTKKYFKIFATTVRLQAARQMYNIPSLDFAIQCGIITLKKGIQSNKLISGKSTEKTMTEKKAEMIDENETPK